MALEKIIIAVCAHTGAGKNVFTEVANNLGYFCFDMGDVVRIIEPARRKIPREQMTKALEEQIRTELRQKYGQDAIARVAAEYIKDQQARIVFVSDVVSNDEINYFKQQFGENFYTVAVLADYETRVKRVTSRAERPRDRSYVDNRDKWATGLGLPQVLESAHYKIENNSDDLTEFQNNARDFILRIVSEKAK